MMLNFVDCEGPAAGDFGQVELDSNNKPFVNGRPVPPPSYPIPTTPPPAGVAPAKQAQARRDLEIAPSEPDSTTIRRRRCRFCINARSSATSAARQRSAFAFRMATSSKPSDYKAARWFGLAVAQGHRASQYALAGMYQEGEGGLPHDDRKATELMIKSANQGYFKAQYALAFQYEIGDGVPRDRQKAIELFRASGDGIGIAAALADPKAPARFTDMIAFARYLSSLRNAEEAASWQQWLNTLPKGGGGCAPSDVGCIMHGSAMSAWRSAGEVLIQGKAASLSLKRGSKRADYRSHAPDPVVFWTTKQGASALRDRHRNWWARYPATDSATGDIRRGSDPGGHYHIHFIKLRIPGRQPSEKNLRGLSKRVNGYRIDRSRERRE